MELIHKNFPEIDMRIVTPCEMYMEEFLRLFRDEYGNTEAYFNKIGLCDEVILKLRRKLLGKRCIVSCVKTLAASFSIAGMGAMIFIRCQRKIFIGRQTYTK